MLLTNDRYYERTDGQLLLKSTGTEASPIWSVVQVKLMYISSHNVTCK